MTETPLRNSLSKPPVKALIFDLMGTCLDWHSTVSPVLEDALASAGTGPTFNALSWRHAFFDEIHGRFKDGLPQEDIDDTHRRTLLALLRGRAMDDDKIEACVNSWHSQTGESHILIHSSCYLGFCTESHKRGQMSRQLCHCSDPSMMCRLLAIILPAMSDLY